MKFNRRSLLLAATGAAAAHALPALASDYPAKPVEMIVPWPAGGGTDVIARVYAEAARTHFAQPILIVNRPGAIGSIGFSEAAAAKPDGYKVVMATPELLIAPYMNIGRARYENFVPIARINADPASITVRTDAPWKTVREFLDHARANPGKVTLATSGNGAIPDIAAAALQEMTGIQFVRVPYQGEAPAIQAALAGQTDATVVAPGAMSSHIQAGKLRVLAVTSAQRVNEFTNVPTLKENGIDLAIGTWRGLMLPKGTPPEVIAMWRELTRQVSAEPRYQETLRKQSVNMIYEEGPAFEAVLRENDALFKRLVPTLQSPSR